MNKQALSLLGLFFFIMLGQSGAAAALTAPAAVAHLTAWYDFSDNTTITSSATYVSQVTDKSGNGNTITQATAAKKPVVTTVAGQQALVFSGGQFLASSTTNTFAAGSNASSIFIVAGYTGTTGYGWPVAIGYGSTSSNGYAREIGKYATTLGIAVEEQNYNNESSASWLTSPSIVYGAFDSASDYIAVNGSSVQSVAATTNTTSGTSFEVGTTQSNLGSAWIGPIYEVIAYNSVLSLAERQFVEGYLACKWGLQSSLPTTHPYSSTCPATASASLTSVLTVTPTGPQLPSTTLTYNETFSNTSNTLIYNPVFDCPIPAHVDFQVGSVSLSLGSTGLTSSVTYSNNNGVSFIYTPVSGGGGAPAGYDRSITDIRLSLTGALGSGSINNSGSISYITKIQ